MAFPALLSFMKVNRKGQCQGLVRLVVWKVGFNEDGERTHSLVVSSAGLGSDKPSVSNLDLTSCT